MSDKLVDGVPRYRIATAAECGLPYPVVAIRDDGAEMGFAAVIPLAEGLSPSELNADALRQALRYASHEVSSFKAERKVRFRDYELKASARFRFNDFKWQPALDIERKAKPDSGDVFHIGGERAGMLSRNPRKNPEQAILFALDVGRRIVAKQLYWPGIR